MFKKLLFAFVAVGMLAFLLGGCAIVDTNTQPTGPTVHMSGADFVQHSITIKKGDSITLVDDAASPHTITNGSWVNGVAKAATENGAPTVLLNFNGNDSASMGPFTATGTFHFYCTIHQNMNLTVVVQ